MRASNMEHGNTATWKTEIRCVTAYAYLYVYAGAHKHVAGSKDTTIQWWDCICDCVKVADSADTTIQREHIHTGVWVGGKALQYAGCEYAYMSVYESACVQWQAMRDTGARV